MSEFDKELNINLHNNVYDTQSTTIGDVIGGVTASVVDMGTSLWNSLPGTEEVYTRDVLSRISNDALRVYEENPDTIQTASFIGGMFLPMGAAIKGMNLARSGVKGASWFNNSNRAEELAKVEQMFGEAAASTAEFRALTRGIYAKTAVNQAIDAVAAEAALIATFNAHPFMEDYMKDLPSNFALSALLGGGLGSGIGAIADRFAIKGATGAALGRSIDTVAGKVESLRPDMPDAFKIHVAHTNMGNLDEIMAGLRASGKDETNDLTFQVAKKWREELDVEQKTLFEEMISTEIKAWEKPAKDTLLAKIIASPEMFGVENMRLLTQKDIDDAGGVIKGPKMPPTNTPVFEKLNTKTGGMTAQEAVFFPELGLYGSKKDAIHYAGAASLGKDAKTIANEYAKGKNWGIVANIDTPLELLGKSAANAEAEYIAAIVRVNAMSKGQLAKLTVGEGDGPLLNALVARMRRDPDLADLKINISDKSPMYKKIISEHEEKLIEQGVLTPGSNLTGLGPAEKVRQGTYAATLDKIALGINKFKPVGVSRTAQSAVTEWIRSPGIAPLRRAAADWMSNKSGMARSGAIPENVALFEELYNSPQSKALRDEFRKLADSDGYVLLYRGVKNDVTTTSPLESYTTHYQKAQEFIGANRKTGVKLNRVHVDNIALGFEDTAGGTSKFNSEILVISGQPVNEAVLTGEGKIVFQRAQDAVASGSVTQTTKKTITEELVLAATAKQVDQNELTQLMAVQKAEAIDSLLANGVPLESIALKTNTKLEHIKSYLMLKASQLPDEALQMLGASKIVSDETIEAALAVDKVPMVLKANGRKNAIYVQNHIALNNRSMRTISNEFMAALMSGSKSTAVQEMARFFHGDGGGKVIIDIIASKIGKINPELAGNAFANSFDFFTRNMADIGPAVSQVARSTQRISNNLINKVITPLNTVMANVQKDITALTEYSIFYNVNATLSGWRGVDKDGFLVQKVIKKDVAGNNVEVLEPVQWQGKPYQIKTTQAKALIEEMQVHSKELLELANMPRKLKGLPDINDIGLWMPALNPVNKFLAYVRNVNTDDLYILWDKTKDGYKQKLDAYRKALADSGEDKIYEVVEQSSKKAWSILNGRLDTVTMQQADLALHKSGKSSSAIIKPDLSLLGEIAAGYEHYITAQVRSLSDINMSEITDTLRKMSEFYNKTAGDQPLELIKKIVNKDKDPAKIVLNTLLNDSNLGEYEGWKMANQGAGTGIAIAVDAVAKVWNDFAKPLGSVFTKDLGEWQKVTTTTDGSGRIIATTSAKTTDRTNRTALSTDANGNFIKEQTLMRFKKEIKWDEFVKKLDAAGVTHPYANFDAAAMEKFGIFEMGNSSEAAKRIVYAGNAIAATAALRFAELAQPLVNALSMPIMTNMALMNKMPDSFLGKQKGTAKVAPAQYMYEGIRHMHSPQYAALNKKWEEAGHFTPLVSEVNDLYRATRQFDKGPIAFTENFLDSWLVQWLSKPSDITESYTRKAAMNIGAVMARRMYPELDDVGITIFARDFMDKALGNYTASQRPVFFQGTAGVALGLFQTYMLTFAQNAYRHLELKNYKVLGKTMLMQGGIFGAGSLPGFDQVSKIIGDEFSDDNIDLTTGTYRAISDPMATAIVYGLPSTLGPAVAGRGGIDARMPNWVGADIMLQSMEAVAKVASSLGKDAPDIGRAFGEALSMQTISRPIARMSEVATGYSITQRGNTVQTPAEVWTMTGIMARVLATRPIEEQKLRDADHLNHFYGAADRDSREVLTNNIRTAIRNGTLTDEKIAEYSEEYLRKGGSIAGWRSAFATAAAKTESSGREALLEKLKNDRAITYMIDNLD
jgi:hypothetical protein